MKRIWIIVGIGVVLVGLAVFGVQKYQQHAKKAKEGEMRANLQRLRAAIAEFQADTGAWPNNLQDIVAPKGSTPTGTEKGAYKGPYLPPTVGIKGTGIPANPYADRNGPINMNWTYSNVDGTVISAVTPPATDPYTILYPPF